MQKTDSAKTKEPGENDDSVKLKLSKSASKDSRPSDIIDVIEKNEKINEAGPEKLIEHPS